MKKHLIIIAVLGMVLSGRVHQCFAQCAAPQASAVLNFNNVSARMNMGGPLWITPEGEDHYEVPIGEIRRVMYAASLWVSGIDSNNQIQIAAMKHGQSGNDFWPGPLDVNAQTDSLTCDGHDRMYKLSRWEVASFRERYNEPSYEIPSDILEWPANGNPYTLFHADAPFVDVNNDNIYDPMVGDYPAFAFDGPPDKDYNLMGDQCVWWIENDNGNVHTETGASAIGIELRCMAYAYVDCGPINDQTFYRYKVKKRSQGTLTNVYLGLFSDPDIGYPDDDYAGCDVQRQLGYVYNSYAIDGSGAPSHYGSDPPAAGMGILSCPMAPLADGHDNDLDGLTDEPDERYRMIRFAYFTRVDLAPPYGSDPGDGSEYYNYMNGQWKDGANFCYGGTGHPSGGCNGLLANYMFPGNSDPLGWGTAGSPQLPWTMQSALQPGSDVRILQSVGPMVLAENDERTIHFAALWSRQQNISNPYEPVDSLKLVYDICKERFEMDFADTSCCPPIAAIGVDTAIAGGLFLSSMNEADSYFWNFGSGNTFTGRFPPLHYFQGNGLFAVTLVVENECGADSTVILYDNILGDGVLQSSLNQLVVYPNPTGDLAFLKLPDNDLSFRINVLDMTGKKLLDLQNQTNIVRLSLKTLSNGIYLIRASSEKEVFTKKIVLDK